MLTTDFQDVLFTRLSGNSGDIGEICLNRPEVLNALTSTMCKQIREQLLSWQQDSSIKAVIVRGTGERAFCAGGDIRSLHDNKNNAAFSLDFFQQEYSLNSVIHHFPKPYISFLDGITMGGGAGLSLHGSHRIATEQFVFAMPETSIGFFPDVGSGYFFNKCPDYSGYYLGLTGEQINAADALMLNLVNYHISRSDIGELINTLSTTAFDSDNMNTVSQIIDRFKLATQESPLAPITHLIDDCFGRSSIEEIFDTLDAINSPWADNTLRTLMKRAPLSLSVALRYLQTAKAKPLDEVVTMDLNIAIEFMKQADFYEGVRAAIIDKDHAPRWQPAKIADVSHKQVAAFFAHSIDLEKD